MSARVVAFSEHTLVEWRHAHAAGPTTSALPYGLEYLETQGLTVVDNRRSRRRWARRVRDAVEYRAGMPLEQPVREWAQVASADLVLALLEQYAAFPAALKRWRVPPFRSVPLATMSCWLGERLRVGTAEDRRQIVRRYADVDLTTVWSRNQVAILTDAGFPAERVAAVPFGVSAGFYTPVAGERDIAVLAVGKDAGRDYGTLFRAVDGTDLRVDLVCQESNLAGLAVPANVHVHQPVSHLEYRSMLRRAQVVVVPTRPLAYPTGQSVALEASACGAAVVVTDTEPMREYVTDGDNGVLVPAADPGPLRSALEWLAGDEPARAALGSRARCRVEEEFTTEAMWAAFLEEVRSRGWLGALT